jgi:hypothetical protein
MAESVKYYLVNTLELILQELALKGNQNQIIFHLNNQEEH